MEAFDQRILLCTGFLQHLQLALLCIFRCLLGAFRALVAFLLACPASHTRLIPLHAIRLARLCLAMFATAFVFLRCTFAATTFAFCSFAILGL